MKIDKRYIFKTFSHIEREMLDSFEDSLYTLKKKVQVIEETLAKAHDREHIPGMNLYDMNKKLKAQDKKIASIIDWLKCIYETISNETAEKIKEEEQP